MKPLVLLPLPLLVVSNQDYYAFPQVGGNAKAKHFLKSQADYREGMSVQEKYNTKAAALYRDKVWLL